MAYTLLYSGQLFNDFKKFKALYDEYKEATHSEFVNKVSRTINRRPPKDEKTKVNSQIIYYEWDYICKEKDCPVRIRLYHQNYKFLKIVILQLYHNHDTAPHDDESNSQLLLAQSFISILSHRWVACKFDEVQEEITNISTSLQINFDVEKITSDSNYEENADLSGEHDSDDELEMMNTPTPEHIEKQSIINNKSRTGQKKEKILKTNKESSINEDTDEGKINSIMAEKGKNKNRRGLTEAAKNPTTSKTNKGIRTVNKKKDLQSSSLVTKVEYNYDQASDDEQANLILPNIKAHKDDSKVNKKQESKSPNIPASDNTDAKKIIDKERMKSTKTRSTQDRTVTGKHLTSSHNQVDSSNKGNKENSLVKNDLVSRKRAVPKSVDSTVVSKLAKISDNKRNPMSNKKGKCTKRTLGFLDEPVYIQKSLILRWMDLNENLIKNALDGQYEITVDDVSSVTLNNSFRSLKNLKMIENLFNKESWNVLKNKITKLKRTPWLCSICNNNIKDKKLGDTIKCEYCLDWVHESCAKSKTDKFFCSKCIFQ